MRTLMLAAAAASALCLLPVSSYAENPISDISSQEVRIGPGGVEVGPRHRRFESRREERRRARAGVCEQLRAACMNKDRLGEQGEGNCRRYRRTCR